MILLGPGGTSGMGYEQGLPHVKSLGLGALEVEFTYGVRMSNVDARKIGTLADSLGIQLSVHAPYFINLVSTETAKLAASRKRILDSCERAHHLGATCVVFHAGFYQGRDKELIYGKIQQQIIELMQVIKAKGWNVDLAPELTGKPSQFGDIDELLRLKKETGCHFTMDFAHWLARTNGKMSFPEMLGKLRSVKHIHAHFSGIEYTAKGERRHLMTDTSQIRDLLKAAIAARADITIINESPDPIPDSVNALRVLEQIRRA